MDSNKWIGKARVRSRGRALTALVASGRHRAAGVFLVGTLGLLLPTGPASAQQGAPETVLATATLSVLTGEVRRISGGESQPEAATDGMDVAVGDHILTGPKSTALVTFLDGTTVTVQPDSEIVIRRADLGGEGSTIKIQINLGKVWARVVRLLDPNSGLSLESNTATATVHDGLIGGEQKSDHTFVCWTKAGELTVRDRHDRTTLVLLPGHKTVVKAGEQSVAVPFAANRSVLRISASPSVFPLVLMPDESRVAGFVAPGIEVNHVFGSFTGIAENGTHVIEVPAGLPGPFALALEGQRDSHFEVRVTGFFEGDQIYQQELSGTIKKGERLLTEVAQEVDEAAGSDPKTAKVRSGRANPLRPLRGPLPGKFLLSPVEFNAASSQ